MDILSKITTIFKFYIERQGIDINNLLKVERLKKDLAVNTNEGVLQDLKNRFQDRQITIYDLIDYSIFIFDNKTKKNNGIAFTPKKVAEEMVNMALENLSEEECRNIKIMDPATGSGIFLVIMIIEIHRLTGKSFKNIIEENIFGIDLIEENIVFIRLLLSVLCIENDNDIPNYINIINYDSLDLTSEILIEKLGNDKFDIVICNPPYVRSKNLSESTKEKIKEFETTYGISDLYISFFEIGTNMLKTMVKEYLLLLIPF